MTQNTNELMMEMERLAQEAERLGPHDLERLHAIMKRAKEVEEILSPLLKSLKNMLVSHNPT
jgi:hypothetical protein